MSILTALDQLVSVQHIGSGTEDDFGDAAETLTGTDEWRGRLVPVSSQEVLNGRDTVTVDLMLWLEPAALIAARDRAVIDGETYEAMGPPTGHRFSGPVHHWEIPVRRIVSG